ncbi:hypothetical protein [Paracoccus benzoatiresistens]|uniref:Uncharacterized protein n=1 Tax=Paracoccus benzoatiresistens TaxID=2997341 RepID=A0ABT4J8S7_9RHOB|nr:hypothetical protein [Paracoccus sp. EF6]MCZ0963496.1 hypothetical protein [Paracoccus sp. EF6]
MIGLFDRQDGAAADWALISETLFTAAFEAIEAVPDETRRLALLRRVHEGSYNRLVGNKDDDGGLSAKRQGGPSGGIDPEPRLLPDFKN